MTKSKIFFILSLSFIGGVASASFYYPRILSLEHVCFFFVLAIILFSVFYRKKTDASMGVSIAASVFFFALGLFLVTLRVNVIDNLSRDEAEFSGSAMIVREPEQKEKYQKIIIKPFGASGRDVLASRKILINVFDKERYEYGDILEVDCRVKIPENFSPDFDWRMYLAKDGIFYVCQNSKIKKTGENKGNVFYEKILAAKNAFNEKIEKLIPAPEAGLISGLLLGGDDLLSEEWQEKFSKTGMTHIVAVSGYNVAIIAEYLMMLGIFLGFWRQQAFWLAVIGIGLFIVMIGLPASAVRAGVMGTLLLWAVKNGRLANSGNAILFAGSVMLFINPLLLRWDIGFQLSFLATIGIIYLYPLFNDFLVRRQKMFGLSEIFFLTMSAQIFVLPVILFNFEKLSLISPLANLLVLPVIPLAMLLGFLAAATGFVFLPLAVVFSWLAFLPLKYETLMIDYMSGLKYSAVPMHISWWGLVGWYIILISGIIFINKKRRRVLRDE